MMTEQQRTNIEADLIKAKISLENAHRQTNGKWNDLTLEINDCWEQVDAIQDDLKDGIYD